MRRCPVIWAISISSSGNSVASDSTMPLPVAVPRCSWKRSIAAMMSSRLVVGACTTAAVPAKETMPTFTSRGRALTKVLAASWEAMMRLGLTSVARMEPETSMASMIVRSVKGSFTTARGRAAAKSSTATAPSIRAGGTCRRQPGPRPKASRATEMLARRTVERLRRPSSHTYRPISAGTASRPHSRFGH